MKHYLENELKIIKKLIKKTEPNTEQYNNLEKSKKYILSIINNEKIEKDVSFNIYEFKDLLYMFINAYSDMKLLDTEFPLDYPMLPSKKIQIDEILEFINSLYYDEIPESYCTTISSNDIKIFPNSVIKSLIKEGNCVVYKKFYKNETIILLDSYNNIKDLIIPAYKSIDIMPYLYYDDYYSQKKDLISNYLKFRAINKLKNTKYSKEAIDYELIIRDSLIIASRAYKKYLNLEEEINIEDYNQLINYLNTVLALELSKNCNITLAELTNASYLDILKQNTELLPNNVGLEDNSKLMKVKNLTKKATNM